MTEPQASGRAPFETNALGRRLVVVSPHLDDAALSLGATIARATRRGTEVEVLTVFAGDPDTDAPASPHDRACGFASAAEAARERRAEDRLACEALGARPAWLSFVNNADSDLIADSDLCAAVVERLSPTDTVLLPGFPLDHGDHLRVARALLDEVVRLGARTGLYVEQPYATWRALSGSRASSAPTSGATLETFSATRRELSHPVVWKRSLPGPPAWVMKHRAARLYRSQLPRLRRVPLLRVALYEAVRRGECLAWWTDESA
ncbi:MAG: PIG-L family deacetylase [Thermoleophilaceae bacterium]|jgi:LmbE family N-acetylglucosaminyl deacetylase